MTRSPGSGAETDRPGIEVAHALMSGADAASCSVLEQGGQLGYVLREGHDATATVTFRLSGDTEANVWTLPLRGVLLLAAHNALIDEISAPGLEQWTWTAAATVITEQNLPAGLILPQSLRRRRLWVLVARDDRGLSGALSSGDSSLSRRGRLGEVLADQVSRTTIEGAAERVDFFKSRRDRATVTSVVAGAVAEYFATSAALTGSDGGQALLTYQVTTFDPVIGSWRTLASFPPERDGTPLEKRRGAISGASMRALEREVSGEGFDSSRSTRSVVSLEAPIVTAGMAVDPVTFGDTLASSDDPAGTVERRLDLGELVARAGLSRMEWEVLQLRADDHTEAEIATILGRSRTTVNTLLLRSRRKLIEAREKIPDNV